MGKVGSKRVGPEEKEEEDAREGWDRAAVGSVFMPTTASCPPCDLWGSQQCCDLWGSQQRCDLCYRVRKKRRREDALVCLRVCSALWKWPGV